MITMNEACNRVYAALKACPMTTAEVAEAAGLEPPVAKKAIRRMKRQGSVVTEGRKHRVQTWKPATAPVSMEQAGFRPANLNGKG